MRVGMSHSVTALVSCHMRPTSNDDNLSDICLLISSDYRASRRRKGGCISACFA